MLKTIYKLASHCLHCICKLTKSGALHGRWSAWNTEIGKPHSKLSVAHVVVNSKIYFTQRDTSLQIVSSVQFYDCISTAMVAADIQK